MAIHDKPASQCAGRECTLEQAAQEQISEATDLEGFASADERDAYYQSIVDEGMRRIRESEKSGKPLTRMTGKEAAEYSKKYFDKIQEEMYDETNERSNKPRRRATATKRTGWKRPFKFGGTQK